MSNQNDGISIRILLPENHQDLKVKILDTDIEVKCDFIEIKVKEVQIFEQRALFDTVRSNESVWTVGKCFLTKDSDSILEISLMKANSSTWPTLFLQNIKACKENNSNFIQVMQILKIE